MKRKCIIAGILLAFFAAAVLVVFATRQDKPQAAARQSIRFTPDGQIVVESPQPQMRIVASHPGSNTVRTTGPAKVP